MRHSLTPRGGHKKWKYRCTKLRLSLMNRTDVLSLLNERREDIQRRFRVKTLGVFGSAARDEMHDGSDVDVLVEFDGPATFDGYMDLKFFLEELLSTKVDLVTDSGLKARARPHVEKDLIRVA